MGRNDDRRGGGDEEIREGARGGRDQFSWDNVKNDRNRQHYVGHSVHANVGRWQKNRDVFWYTKENSMNLKESEALRRKEIEAVKAKEEEYMLMAMGIKPSQPVVQHVSQEDLNRVMKAGTEAPADEAAVQGLGCQSSSRPAENTPHFTSMTELAGSENVLGPSSSAIKADTERVKGMNRDRDRSLSPDHREKHKKKKSKKHRRSHHSRSRSPRSRSRHRTSASSRNDKPRESQRRPRSSSRSRSRERRSYDRRHS